MEEKMIPVTRLNGSSIWLNSQLIEHIESTPDTVITLNNGQKMVVLEPAADVVERVIAFHRKSLAAAFAECGLGHA